MRLLLLVLFWLLLTCLTVGEIGGDSIELGVLSIPSSLIAKGLILNKALFILRFMQL
jgi:hypothetical protein